jgi:hypothetical protein
MRFLCASLLALLPASAGAVAVESAPLIKGPLAPSLDNCPRTTRYYAYKSGEALKPQKLNELPPANVYAAVLHHDGRCEVPIVIKYGVGGR